MRRLLIVALAMPLLGWQVPPQFPGAEEPKRMPDGRLQSEVILKSEHEKNLEELGRIDALLDGVAREIAAAAPGRSDAQLSKDLEEVEKLARRVRNRMTKY